jgi:hypothetical protein
MASLPGNENAPPGGPGGASLAAAFCAAGHCSVFSEEAYQALSARDKCALVWSLVEEGEGAGPGPATLGMGMVTSGFLTSHDFTMEHFGDELRAGRRKFIHQTGLVARARFDTRGYEDHAFTGIFGAGAEHCLLRCSMARRTAAADEVTATPGVAVKFFRSGCHSGNVLAMYGVDGQHSWNFFRFPLRTAVEEATEFKTKLLGKAFAWSGTFPGRIALSDMAARDEAGAPPEHEIDFPFQLEFHPPADLSARFGDEFDAEELADEAGVGAMAGHGHMKTQLETLREGDVVFEVRAWPDPWVADRAALAGLSADAEEMRKRDGGDTAVAAAEGESVLSGATAPVTIGKLVLTSPFVESVYADTKLFFKHQRYEEDLNLRPEWGCPAWYALGQQGASDANKLRAAEAAVGMRSRGQGTLIKNHAYHLRRYPNTLIGEDAVAWMVDQGFARDRVDAVLLGRLMVAAGALRHVAREHTFEDAHLFYCFDARGHAGVCPAEWVHPAGSLCPAAGGRGAPRPHHHHRLVQRPGHGAAGPPPSTGHASGAASAAATGVAGEAQVESGDDEACPRHHTVASLHRTMA